MNICIESQLLNHPRRSGLMTYTEGLVNSLCAHDKVNEYSLAYYSLRRKASEMPGPIGANFNKVVLPVPDREFWARQWWIDQVVLPSYLKSSRTKIFHRPSGYTMPAVKNVFKILTVHDLRTLMIGDKVWAQDISDYKRTLAEVDLCVVVSECTKIDLITHLQMSDKKIKVAYLGADERFQPAKKSSIDAVKSKYQINEPFLLSIGSVPRKNIEGIIKGFAGSRYRDKFLLVLSCNIAVEKYRQLIKELNLENRIKILEKLTDQDVVSLYSSCHCFVFPSLYEGFGLPIVEAMQCGAPVITSNLSSCPEVAGDAAILVDPQNIGEISDAIDQICSNDGLRRSLIEKGYSRAKVFSWDNFGQQMKEIYAMAK